MALRKVIVVPDGLQAERGTGRALPQPSFMYRGVLDHAARQYLRDTLYLAPANDFGCGVCEQAAAAAYLRKAAPDVVCVAVAYGQSNYIDTRGNARGMRLHFEQRSAWPVPPITLIAARPHARRAALCFRKEGFLIERLVAVDCSIPPEEPVVSRLWYYRWPTIHATYEALAYLRDLLRPAA